VLHNGIAQSDALIRLLMRYGRSAANTDRILTNNPMAAPFVKRLKDNGYGHRPAQVEAYLSLIQPMREGKIALVEAGTGTGKSVAMLMAAEDWAKRHGKRCLIAVPTLNIVRQMEREAERLGIDVRTVAGRQQFVSEHRAEDLALKLDKTHRAQIRWWIDNRAQAADWSMDDFLAYVDVNRDWVSLESVSDASDRGFLAWKAQFEREATHDSEVIICTHTMLALDFMLRQREGRKDDEVSELLAKAFGKEHEGFFEYINEAGQRIAVMTEESERSGDDRSQALGVARAKVRLAILRAGKARIELIEYVAAAGRPYDRHNNDVGTMHIGFQVADIEAAYRHLLSHGVRFTAPPTTIPAGPMEGWRWTYFFDPDGVPLEIIQPL